MTQMRNRPGELTGQIRRSGPPPRAANAINIENTDDSTSTSSRCQRCSREIRSARSIARAHGPVCWHRRHDASVRLAPLDCGCPDPWLCSCTEPALTNRTVDGYADAARFIRDSTGCTPLLSVHILRALHRRGGADRALAEQLYSAVKDGVAAW